MKTLKSADHKDNYMKKVKAKEDNEHCIYDN